MLLTVTDYIPVDQRAAELGCSYPTQITILPDNFAEATSRDNLYQSSEAATIQKILINHGVAIGTLLPTSERLPYRVQKDFEWVALLLFIPLAVMNQNPALVSLALNVIANYVTNFFKGIPGTKTAKLDIVTATRGRKFKKISYEGSIEGLRSLPEILREISDD
jgi:hypothetical protein